MSTILINIEEDGVSDENLLRYGIFSSIKDASRGAIERAPLSVGGDRIRIDLVALVKPSADLSSDSLME